MTRSRVGVPYSFLAPALILFVTFLAAPICYAGYLSLRRVTVIGLGLGPPMMRSGLVTTFLFQFVAIWNNFMLPYIMLGDDRLFPVTVGLNGLLNQGASQPAMYTSVITGALLSILPLIALFLCLQRYWRVDLGAGAVKA